MTTNLLPSDELPSSSIRFPTGPCVAVGHPHLIVIYIRTLFFMLQYYRSVVFIVIYNTLGILLSFFTRASGCCDSRVVVAVSVTRITYVLGVRVQQVRGYK